MNQNRNKNQLADCSGTTLKKAIDTSAGENRQTRWKNALKYFHAWHQPAVLFPLVVFLFTILTCIRSEAHEGPPFPILMDEPIPGYSVSVWADPDIGTGQFFVITEPTDKNSDPIPGKVEVWVQPKNERLPKATYQAVRQHLRNQIQFLAEPLFDQQEMFNVGIVITNANGESNQLLTEVEATPPGLGVWDFAIYLFPFVLFGGLWTIGFAKSRRRKRGPLPSEHPPDLSSVHDVNQSSKYTNVLVIARQGF